MDTDSTSIADILRGRVSASSDSPAMRFEGRVTTLRSLDQRANQVAHALRRSLPGAHGRAGILDTNSDVFFEILFGAAKANRMLVPLNYRLAPTEIAHIVNDADIEILFAGRQFLEVAEGLTRLCPRVSQIVVIGDEGSEGAYDAWRDREPDDDPGVPVSRSDVILIVYTSGTTGFPKGTLLTHGNLLTNASLLADEYGRSPELDNALVCMPLFHVSGSLWALACLYAGSSLVILPRVIPSEILRSISEHRITKALFVPAVIQMLLDALGQERHDVSSLEFVLYGGSPTSPALLRRAMSTLGCDLGQVYGLTETAGSITYLSPQDHDTSHPARLESCGKPLRHVEVRIVDGSDHPLEQGHIGEIVCRTAQNMSGYWNRPDDTADALRNGWLHTGDLGFFDEEGYLYIHDRLKDVIVRNAENVYPAEVERVLVTHPGVADVAVIGIPDDRYGEAIKALVVKKRPAVTSDELVSFCRERLGRFKVPDSIDFVETLKRSAAGKLLKHELRAPFWSGRTRHVN
jgi:acyl-CoA synthetase (AMP-forming)/AMP-acid ligase II